MSMTRKCHNHRPIHGTRRKRHRTLTATWQQEDNECKATSSLFLSEMIAKLEMTLRQGPNTKKLRLLFMIFSLWQSSWFTTGPVSIASVGLFPLPECLILRPRNKNAILTLEAPIANAAAENIRHLSQFSKK